MVWVGYLRPSSNNFENMNAGDVRRFRTGNITLNTCQSNGINQRWFTAALDCAALFKVLIYVSSKPIQQNLLIHHYSLGVVIIDKNPE